MRSAFLSFLFPLLLDLPVFIDFLSFLLSDIKLPRLLPEIAKCDSQLWKQMGNAARKSEKENRKMPDRFDKTLSLEFPLARKIKNWDFVWRSGFLGAKTIEKNARADQFQNSFRASPCERQADANEMKLIFQKDEYKTDNKFYPL